MMKLTKNLYDCEEVCLSLMWSIIHEQRYETAFWTQELIDSGYYSDLVRILFRTWIWHCISSIPQWIDLLRNQIDTEEFPNYHGLSQILITALSKNGIDHRLWNTLVVGSFHIEYVNNQSIKQSTDNSIDDSADSIDYINDVTLDTILEYIHHGSILDAWLAVCTDMTTSWTILSSHGIDMMNDYETYIHSNSNDDEYHEYTHLHWNIIMLCAVLVRIYALELNSSYSLIQQFTNNHSADQTNQSNHHVLPSLNYDHDIINFINNLKTTHGRKRRIYAIPSECLYGQCSRGIMYNQNNRLKCLYNIYDTLGSEPKNSFWYNQWKDISKYMVHVDNYTYYDMIEEFHIKYFPDDTPDEWSIEDQLKSHGYGVYETTDGGIILLDKLSSIWFPDVTPPPPSIEISMSFDEIAELYCNETFDEWISKKHNIGFVRIESSQHIDLSIVPSCPSSSTLSTPPSDQSQLNTIVSLLSTTHICS